MLTSKGTKFDRVGLGRMPLKAVLEIEMPAAQGSADVFLKFRLLIPPTAGNWATGGSVIDKDSVEI